MKELLMKLRILKGQPQSSVVSALGDDVQVIPKDVLKKINGGGTTSGVY